MLIGIDASRALRAHRTGTERYNLELINALLDLQTEHRLQLYISRQPGADLFHPGAELVLLPGQRLWTHTRLGPHTRRHPPDVLFVPAHVLPLVGPPRSVVTVHDLGYEYFPQAHPLRQRLYLRWTTRRHARLASRGQARILADSQATKDDLVRLYNAASDRIHVVYPAPDPTLAPEHDPQRIARVLESYGLPPNAEYILHVGTLQPRKNLIRLIDAFAALRQQLPDRPLHLLLAGSPGFNAEVLYRRVADLGLEALVRFTGFARVHDMPALYSGAACYAFPSLYEGFGFPALEAQLCETPLVCARASSLPEVAGDAALYFDPTDTAALTVALRQALTQPDLRADLIARGRANAARFSWPQTARATLAVLESR